MTHETTEWIEAADYETLLRRWRFRRTGDPLFDGLDGGFFVRTMLKKRDALLPIEVKAISERVCGVAMTPSGPPLVTCEACDGTGGWCDDEDEDGCDVCDGSGVVIVGQAQRDEHFEEDA